MNGEDSKYRSRKWVLATRTFWVATAQHAILQLLIFGAMVTGRLEAGVWSDAVSATASVWVWAVAAVLGLYGLANVTALKFKNGGVS